MKTMFLVVLLSLGTAFVFGQDGSEVSYTPWVKISNDTWMRSRAQGMNTTQVVVRVVSFQKTLEMEPQQSIEYKAIISCHDLTEAGWITLLDVQVQEWMLGEETGTVTECGEVINGEGVFESDDPKQLITDFGVPTELIGLASKYMTAL